MVGEIGAEALEGCAGGKGVAGAVYHLTAVALQDGDEEVREFPGGLEAEVFLVVPLGLVRVELCAGFLDFIKGKSLYKLVQGEHFAVVAGVPAKHRKKVHEGLREIAVLAVAVGNLSGLRVLPGQGEHREAQFVTVALGKFSVADRLQEKAQVRKAGHGLCPAECLVEHIVKGKGREPLLSADHLRYFHKVVVNYVCEVVGGEFIGPFPENFIVEGVSVHFHVAAD